MFIFFYNKKKRVINNRKDKQRKLLPTGLIKINVRKIIYLK